MKHALIIALLTLAAVAHAQTISPVIQECGHKCSGTFKLTNNSLNALAVVVEPKQFVIVNGKQVFQPLSADVKLSETSARIGPKQSHDFDVRVRCFSTPCSIQLEVSMVLGRTLEGLSIKGILPEIFYVCDKQRECRKRTLESAGVPVQ